MLRHKFDQELQRLQDEVLVLGSLVEKALVRSVELLKQRDLAGSRRLIAGDRLINERRYALEAETIALIATQQPMAGDMRLLAAILEIITELERIGDYAKGIARINLAIGDKPLIMPLIDLPVMADKACHMLRQALDAFVHRDVALARAIPRQDDEVDALYNQVFRVLLSHIISSPGTLEQATYLLWAAHNLERTADRVINICERVIYTVTGEMQELDVDDTSIESLT
jgi:phosphate transport system protein